MLPARIHRDTKKVITTMSTVSASVPSVSGESPICRSSLTRSSLMTTIASFIPKQ
ncbi:MAG TPA: hypothetical protein QGF58_27915 [Myxococcota bacterium]|nr:hypothetical protein [Myxococcota bacterium]